MRPLAARTPQSARPIQRADDALSSTLDLGEIASRRSVRSEFAAGAWTGDKRAVISHLDADKNLPRNGTAIRRDWLWRMGIRQVVTLEPASMPGRVVIQWDKDDCAEHRDHQVDCGDGELAAIERSDPIIGA